MLAKIDKVNGGLSIQLADGSVRVVTNDPTEIGLLLLELVELPQEETTTGASETKADASASASSSWTTTSKSWTTTSKSRRRRPPLSP